MSKFGHVHFNTIYDDNITVFIAQTPLFKIIKNPKVKSGHSAIITIPAAFFDCYDNKTIVLDKKHSYRVFLKEINQKLKDFNVNNAIAVEVNYK
jgi:hypothetical protein